MINVRSLAYLRMPFMAAVFALCLGFPGKAFPLSYPALDSTSHWTLQDWGFSSGKGFFVQGAEKKVWISPGQPASKTAFYNLAVVGAKLNGSAYPLLAQEFMGEMEGVGYLAKYGSFKVKSGISLTIVLFFMDDGKFEFNAYFGGPDYAGNQPWEIVLRVDYDMAGAGNNIAEFLWNRASEGGSLSPPQAPKPEVSDGRLVYAPSKSAGSGYWAASAHEIAVAYPPIPRGSGPAVENAGFARVLNASSPQFGMVLWNDAVTPVEALFKTYSGFDGNLNPKASITTSFQFTADAAGLPRYAYAGRDQMLFLTLGAPNGGGTYGFGGKLFHRAGTRPMMLVIHQHPPENIDGFFFDVDRVLRVTNEGPRTFRNALAALPGENDFTAYRSAADGIPYLPFDGFPGPGQSVSEAQLHNLLTSSRDNSAATLENVRDWRVDLLIVNWTLQGEPGAWEAMFDNGAADANGIPREGAAVFWPALKGRGLDFQTRQATLSALHAIGLTFNMDPSWSNCPFAGYCWNDGSACGGRKCGAQCPPGSQGCRYSAYTCAAECREGTVMSLTDVDNSTVGFNRNAAPGSNFSEFDWYRRAPEAWVKPGRFGAPPISGAMPPFIPN